MESMNLKKLAQRLNLSVSTVSKAFRNSYDISPETRERILQMARELDYQPNPYASGLRTQKSRTIALIIPEVANNFFTQAINGIESIAQQKQYHVLIYLTHEDREKEAAFARHLQSGRVEGVLISLSDGTSDLSHLDLLMEKGIPLVFFDRVMEQANAYKVTTDDFHSGYLATQHLVEQGCRKIAHLLFSKNLSIAGQRMQGYLQALKDNALPVDKKMILHLTNDNNENFQQIKKLLSRKNRPDGIFSSFEKLALTTYEVCEALQVNIPGDVKISSFSNMEAAPLLNPSLTTITQPAFDMGKEAATLLFRQIENISVPSFRQTIIPSRLIKRRSTACDPFPE